MVKESKLARYQALQAKQKDITRAMCAQIINNPIDTTEIRWQPILDALQKAYPVGRRARLISFGQCLSGYGSKCAEDIAFITSPVTNLLLGSLFRSQRFGPWLGAYQPLSQIALGCDRTRFVCANIRDLPDAQLP